MMALLKQFIFFGGGRFPIVANPNQKRGMSLQCGMQPFMLDWHHFHGLSFEICSKKTQQKKAKTKTKKTPTTFLSLLNVKMMWSDIGWSHGKDVF